MSIEKSGISRRSIAESLGVTTQALIGWMSTGKISREKLAALAKLLGVRLDWYLDGSGPMLSPVDVLSGQIFLSEIPVAGTTAKPPVLVKGGKQVEIINVNKVVSAPAQDPDAYALIVVGGEMSPRYREGEALIVYPGVAPEPGDEVVCFLPEGSVLVRSVAYIRNGEVALDTVIPGAGDRLVRRLDDFAAVHVVMGGFSATSIKPANLPG